MREGPWVLGISASHNGSACIMRGSDIVCAVQEERLTRVKRARVDFTTPARCINCCLTAAHIAPQQLDAVVFSAQGRVGVSKGLGARHPQLKELRPAALDLVIPHHLAHAFSAFGTSGFDESTVLVLDGVGSPVDDLSFEERRVSVGDRQRGWETISLYLFNRGGWAPVYKFLAPEGRWITPHPDRLWSFMSLGGMFASAGVFSFSDVHAAGKVMGLAAHGSAGETTLVDFNEGYPRFAAPPEQFTGAARWPFEHQKHADLAATAQRSLEQALIAISAYAKDQTPFSSRLAYAGGCALNCHANAQLARSGLWDDFHVVPAAEDSGVAIGCALYGLYKLDGQVPSSAYSHDWFGRSYGEESVRAAVESMAGSLQVVDVKACIAGVSDLLADGSSVALFEGSSEFGPRALGHRSILLDPRLSHGKDLLNREVKGREWFRPFGASILEEHAQDWLEWRTTPIDHFMLATNPLLEERQKQVPAVVHADGTTRPQLIRSANEGALTLRTILEAFYRSTGVPLLLNTSFNRRGEPIVETPSDAVHSFNAMPIDYLQIGDLLISRRSG